MKPLSRKIFKVKKLATGINVAGLIIDSDLNTEELSSRSFNVEIIRDMILIVEAKCIRGQNLIIDGTPYRISDILTR
jgi:hypothetical protein